jgi:hypothetical protein
MVKENVLQTYRFFSSKSNLARSRKTNSIVNDGAIDIHVKVVGWIDHIK